MLVLSIIVIIIICVVINAINNSKYKQLEAEVSEHLGFPIWNCVDYYDDEVVVKSRQALEKYDYIKYFKDDKNRFEKAEKGIEKKSEITKTINKFLESNEYEERSQYNRILKQLDVVLRDSEKYRVAVEYITSAGNNLASNELTITQYTIKKIKEDPSLLMTKGEYSKFIKEQQKIELERKHHTYYDTVNNIIEYANANRDCLIIKGSQEQLDNLVEKLFDKTVNTIKKIKTTNSEEWDIIGNLISDIDSKVKNIVAKNKKFLDYYESSEFLKIKETCDSLMSSQREFNEYIKEKVESISTLFGSRVVRNETVTEDEYQYIRPYKKTITPFTAEVSSTVFASAENNPLEYVIKNFYPNKKLYPEQIQKLHLLVEELATLRDAKQIIENYKAEYRQYLVGVPKYIMQEDESGFYSRLGFANIDESVLTVEYKFSYTSGGGMAKRTFSVPMTEENIVELIQALEGKLTAKAFTKEQRALMTNKLREFIKQRDNFTCCNCGNSVHEEPNLLLEIDHIVPVSKGGCTVEENLQTLCWKCNRTKGSKLLN